MKLAPISGTQAGSNSHWLFVLFTSLLYFVCVGCFGQTYAPLPDSNAVWSINIGCTSQVPPNDVIGETYHHSVVGDTVIGTQSYNKIYVSVDSSFNYASATYAYAIREDTNKRVYYVYENDTLEKLLYDFSMNPGDTVWIHPPELGWLFCQDSCMMVADSVDSVLIGGDYRRQLHFSYHNDIWIEGIGSIKGLIYPAYLMPDCGKVLLCFSENDTVKYIDDSWGTCYYKNTGINEITGNSQFKIHPNPTTGVARIMNLPAVPIAIGRQGVEVFDLLGQPVSFHFDIQRFTLDIQHSPSGIYFVRVGEIVRKLVKQ